MNNSQISRLSVIAVIAASLLAVGVITAVSMTEEAEAVNRISQSSSVSVSQSGGGSSSVTVSVTHSQSQSNGVTQSASQSNSVTATQTN
jgi:hypothetical protein